MPFPSVRKFMYMRTYACACVHVYVVVLLDREHSLQYL